MCVLAVYNKAQVQRISNREFKCVVTFHGETCVMSHQSLEKQYSITQPYVIFNKNVCVCVCVSTVQSVSLTYAMSSVYNVYNTNLYHQ